MITNMNTFYTGLLLAVLILPTVSSAAENRPMLPRTASSTLDKALCSQLDVMKTTALAKLDERASSVGGRTRGTVDTKRVERMNTLTTKRTEHDATRKTHYDTLQTKTITDIQKAAVATFEVTVESLVTERKATIDAAIKAFEDGVGVLRTTVDTTTGSVKTKVAADITEIFSTAKTACDAGKSATEVRDGMRIGMESMKAEHQTNREQYSFKAEFDALRTTRRTAEAAAVAKFKVGFEAAKVALKASFTPA